MVDYLQLPILNGKNYNSKCFARASDGWRLQTTIARRDIKQWNPVGSLPCNVKVVASKVPLTVGASAHTIYGRNKHGKRRFLYSMRACMHQFVNRLRLEFYPPKSSITKRKNQIAKPIIATIVGNQIAQLILLAFSRARIIRFSPPSPCQPVHNWVPPILCPLRFPFSPTS